MQTITASVMPLYAVPEQDAKKFIEWIYGVRNEVCFDMDTLAYPRSCMTRAQNEDGTLLMIPLQPVLMFESMVRKPGITARQTAMGMAKIGEVVEKVMVDTMHREAFFITNSLEEVDAVTKRGWTVAMYDSERKIWLMKKKTDAAKYTGPIKVEGKS